MSPRFQGAWTLGLIVALQLAAPTPVLAQPQPETSGVIGRIFVERTNEVLVQVVLLVDSVRRDLPVSSQGRFVLTNLAPGRHRVEVRKEGLATYTEEVLIRQGTTLTLNVSLK